MSRAYKPKQLTIEMVGTGVKGAIQKRKAAYKAHRQENRMRRNLRRNKTKMGDVLEKESEANRLISRKIN